MQGNYAISLDGAWDFQFGFAEEPDEHAWRPATVPMPWQAQFDDLRLASGLAWYRRSFEIDLEAVEYPDKAAVLHFGAVDYQATVWLNGHLIGEHEGGYLPFEFDVINTVVERDNVLVVRVVDANDDRLTFPEFPFSEVPHGKQSWYGPIGGIWQSVWLEIRPRLHIAQLLLQPDPASATIKIEATLSDNLDGAYQILCALKDSSGKPSGSAVFDRTLQGQIQLDQEPNLWSPQSPHLYTVEATLRVADLPSHTVTKQCGFRIVEARDGRLFLNGEPIYLRGVLDQAYYPETIYTPNSEELLERQARELKSLGFNCLRTHIKVEDPRYYDVADRVGLLVWTEIPNWALLTDKSARRAKQTFRGMVERDGHHPAIIAWTLVNENWGTDLTRNEEHRRWLADFCQEAKAIDPTRLVIDNSACCDNAHVAGDLEDFHHYRAIPDHAAEWDEWVAEFAGRSNWAWYSDHEQARRRDLPLIVSEFGNWGLPDPATIREHGEEPWWFETGLNWGGGIVYPHGVLGRYEACGLGDLFPSFSEFARQSQEHMARSLHYEITSMRLHDSIAGYVITEFTDVHWECNGLLTMQREPKHALDPLLKDVNQDDVILLRPNHWSGRPGETLEVVVQTKDILGQQDIGVIQWEAGELVGELPAGSGVVSVKLGSPGVVTFSAEWIGPDAELLANNQVNLVCVDTSPVTGHLRVVGNPELAGILRSLGYRVSEENNGLNGQVDALVVASHYTEAIARHLQRGGRVLYLAGEPQPGDNLPLPFGSILPREGTVWQGDWATSFSWVKKHGPLGHLPEGPILEMAWEAIMPAQVIDGLPLWVQRHHSWAGLAVGWVHRVVSLLADLPYGRGRLLTTTFKLNAATLSSDAVAQALFAGILNLLGENRDETAAEYTGNIATDRLPADS